ncbi:porin family protein [Hymenobacter perfusus]|uniref:PorT family protein n=1 Tax=Hymenobacter perfusus TaxID=1236770 RepID=A0A3R9P790_9BACT|nr:porin family protein [Hymenobacter perfusus]RSK45736.1 PorT family protein [Hymenobacter perfusus]
MKKLLLSIVFLLAAIDLSAQTNFVPGYVVTLSGDTLRGEVDYRGAQRSARQARFRTAAGAEVTEYTPAQIRGYGFPRVRLYESHKIITDTASQRQQYFLEILAAGKASVYSFRDGADKERYYLGVAAEPVVELVQRTVRVQQDNQFVSEEQFIYRNTLATAFQDCPAVQRYILRLPLRAQALADLVTRYNNCSASEVPRNTNMGQRPKDHLTLLVLAGAGTSTLSITGSSFNSDGKYAGSVDPLVGLGVNLTIPAVSEKLSLQLEAYYHAQEYTVYSSSGTGNGAASAPLTLSYIRMPLILRYTARKGKVRPYLQLGFGGGFALEEKSHLYLFPTFTINPTGVGLVVDRTIRRFELLGTGGIGLRIGKEGQRKLGVEARLERGNGFSTVTGTTTAVTRIFGLLSYDLTK